MPIARMRRLIRVELLCPNDLPGSGFKATDCCDFRGFTGVERASRTTLSDGIV